MVLLHQIGKEWWYEDLVRLADAVGKRNEADGYKAVKELHLELTRARRVHEWWQETLVVADAD